MMRRMCTAWVAAVLLCSCSPHVGSVPESSIGTATMTEDGTIVLDLHSKTPDGTIAEARITYPKDHKQYAEILKHLGGLTPGQTKSVPPWPGQP